MLAKCLMNCIILALLMLPLARSQTGITRDDYLEAIKNAEAEWWTHFLNILEALQKRDFEGKARDGIRLDSHQARLSGILYAATGEKTYAEHAKLQLLNLTQSDNYPSIMVLNQIKDSGVLSEQDIAIIDRNILEGSKYPMEYWVEWGAMNHCTNHIVNSLTATMHRFPKHPDFLKWKQKRDINLSGSWGLWSIEDSQIYIPVWLKPMMQYAEMEDVENEFYALPTTRYYFDYLVQLLTPGGQIAEFGDGRYGRGYTWTWMISVLEKGASVYGDGRMKWAAHRLFETHFKELGHQADRELVDAYLWADDTITERIPTDRSRLVLEDYVGKKVVFRDGWDRKATFLFLNFLDDPPFGIDGKEYILNTINVETEKNHHGHADENAICQLMKNGCILLYESSYRETSSTGPDGQFRADVFHNKLVVRNGLAHRDWRLLPFLLDGGRYKFVNTQLMHFRRFKEVDISRTRLTDEKLGYQWDRLINYMKAKDWFIIFDIVKFLKSDKFTLANLYHTQLIDGFDHQNPVWFDTYYSSIAGHPNPDSMRLLIYFPEGTAFRIGTEQHRNNQQTEWAVYAARVDSFRAGDLLVMPTILAPHHASVPPATIVAELEKMKIFHEGNGYGIQLPAKDGFVQFNAMLDLEAEYLKRNIRPRYTFESGRAEYGDLVTDARYCYLRQNTSQRQNSMIFYSFFKASRLIFNSQILFDAPGMLIGQDDGGYNRWGVPKWLAWEDSVKFKR
ncbi:hypothetical protein JXJ21_19000 [candidate division KSB1 bacterium]|nr:hypothetical protein [candidate division KSB1 bacterium]